MHKVLNNIRCKFKNVFSFIDDVSHKKTILNKTNNIIPICCKRLLNGCGYKSAINKLYLDTDMHKTTRQAVTKYRSKIESSYFEYLHKIMLDIYTSRYPSKKKYYAVDVSTIRLSKKQAKNGYPLTKMKRYCNGYLTSIYDISSGTIISTHISKTIDDRQHFIDIIKKIDKNGLYIFDRGYISNKFIDTLLNNNINFIIRMIENKNYAKKYLKNLTTEQMVDIDYKKNDTFIKLRGIKYFIDDSPFYLITSNFNHTLTEYKQLYHGRWVVEEYFKIVKHTYNGKRYMYVDENLILQDIHLISFMHNLVRFISKLSIEFYPNKKGKLIIPHNPLTLFIFDTSKKDTYKLDYNNSADLVINYIFPMLMLLNNYNSSKLDKIVNIIADTYFLIINNRHQDRVAIFPPSIWYFRCYMSKYNPP